jgi:hypothetical protein
MKGGERKRREGGVAKEAGQNRRGGRKEGREGGTTKGRKEGRKGRGREGGGVGEEEGRKEGGKEGRKEGRKGRKGGRLPASCTPPVVLPPSWQCTLTPRAAASPRASWCPWHGGPGPPAPTSALGALSPSALRRRGVGAAVDCGGG